MKVTRHAAQRSPRPSNVTRGWERKRLIWDWLRLLLRLFARPGCGAKRWSSLIILDLPGTGICFFLFFSHPPSPVAASSSAVERWALPRTASSSSSSSSVSVVSVVAVSSSAVFSWSSPSSCHLQQANGCCADRRCSSRVESRRRSG